MKKFKTINSKINKVEKNRFIVIKILDVFNIMSNVNLKKYQKLFDKT